ncbi:MAG: type IX secretion system sortase PorU [Bacteroidales bacterium]
MHRIFIFLVFLACLPVYAQSPQGVRAVNWYDAENPAPDEKTETGNALQEPFLFFNRSSEKNAVPELPVYNELLFAPGYYPDHYIELSDMYFEVLKDQEPSFVEDAGRIEDKINLQQEWVISRGQPALQISFIPLRRDPITGTVEKLMSFSVNFRRDESEVKSGTLAPKRSYTSGSVLSSGKWVMIKTFEDGVYRLSYNDLAEMGIDNPANLRIFGNGNRMLPKMNDLPRPDDLIENRIFMHKGDDGIFNQGDYILFYGQGPVHWEYNEAGGMFEHEKHLYSDGSYYFLTSSAAGKNRITKKQVPEDPPGMYIEEFDDYAYHEEDIVNLLKSGRDWFGEHFKMINSYDFSFDFPDIAAGSQIRLKWRAASRSPVATSFDVMHNSTTVDQLNFTQVNMGSVVSDYAVVREGTATFDATGDRTELSVKYSQNTASAEGWLDYLILNVRRSLVMTGNQMHFRDLRSVGEDRISEFRLKNAGTGIRVWDITDPLNISELNTEIYDNNLIFKDITSELKQYIAFNSSDLHEPEVIGPIPNQNLHGINAVDMIIISHPIFLNQASQLADHRRNNDGLEVVIVTPEQVYNEFSSGKTDITALRDFVKMFYDRAADESEMPDYLLLFGKGSYDNRPGNPSGVNFIPTYQSHNSFRPTQSFVSDDFFGLLDDDEGEFSGAIDIGIGRLPVSTPDQAQSVVNKIIDYNKAVKKGDWQNLLCFIGDDGDNNIHMRDADILAEGITDNYPSFNIEKIYLDAWPKTGTSLGQRYPEVNQAITERIRKGALIINYTGHGNELRLADENILDINDVASWTNRDRLPVFMTATCEFSRFDNPERVSAGEMLLLNPQGGSIALFSTTRLVYATPNFFLNQSFYRFILEKMHNGQYMRLGDAMRLTKINSGSGINKRNFTLLGDPSMRLAVPEHKVVITSMNEFPVSETPDTLKALSKVSVSGKITNEQGIDMEGFGGMIYHTVYDKKILSSTLGNDGSTPFNYSSRNNIIYKGKATVNEGKFSFSFIVPKDIAYHYDNGKISSFATSGKSDAAGYFDNVIIGGSEPGAASDDKGPEIELYMNDMNFVSGGITDQNPGLLALLTDSSGINTVASGIGHDITLVLNNDPSGLLLLNDYYVADADSYQSGSIKYNFTDLDEGDYNLKLKAWDVYNNSSEATLDFSVIRSSELSLSHVFNYPNPFTQETAFHFEHNQSGAGIDVLIQIFTVSGRLVKTIDTFINTPGFKPDPVPWDGLDDYGDKIGRGVYIYRLRIRTENGQTAEKYEKLVILK